MNIGKYTGGGSTTTCWICIGVCSMGFLSMASVCVMIAFTMLNYFQRLYHICCLIHLYSGFIVIICKRNICIFSARDPKIFHVQNILHFYLQPYESIRLMKVWYIYKYLFLQYANQDTKYSSHFQRIAEACREIRNE